MTLIQFFERFWPVLEPNTPLEINWHHHAIASALTQHTYRVVAHLKKEDAPEELQQKDLIINVPPRTTKSVLVTVMFPVWAWTIDPTLSFLTASYSGTLATKHARLSRTLIQSDEFIEEYPGLFQIKTDQNVKSHYENTVGGGRFGIGMQGSATGSGGDFIIIDDPLNPKEASSDVERANANRNYSETFYNRTKNPATAARIIIMQRLHEEDLTGYLLQNDPKGYYHINIPAEGAEDCKPEALKKYYQDGLFWPDRFSRNLLSTYKTALGSYGYAGQYLQRPSPAEGGLIKRHWFKFFNKLHDNITINVKIDPAYTSKEAGDPTAILAYYELNGLTYITNVEAVRMEFPDLCNYIKGFALRNGLTRASRIFVEPKASGKSIVQALSRETELNVVEDINPTKDKVARVQDVSAIIEAGKVYLLTGTWNDPFLNECAAFPNAKHDDMVDTLVMALSGVKSKFFVL